MKKIIFVTAASLVILSGCSQVQDWSEQLFGQKQQETKEKEPSVKTPDSQGDQTTQDPTGQPSEETVPPELQLESQYFNEVKVVDGKQVIQNPANLLALVNKEYALDEYKPADLVRPNVPFVFGNQELEKANLRKEAAEQLEKMFSEAKEQGVYLTAISGYRSYDYQKMLLEREIAQFGKEKAVMAVAPPGQSEHQSGLAMDISSKNNNFQVNIEFAQTKEGKWLAEHSYKYGFILRYPEDKVSITQYQYEPWHFRYVGIEAAKVIHENDWSLEEYFNNVKKI
ncbi:D-alanyl-D-alanine carboxypeptidase family protein [Bacillus sp. BHET2]|uniref:M15 family metallopeptidase n=1 Tax=Bacillus sp. BHET2 TaxID=2583818 RepID=UPI00110F3B4F|nr:M15 family metallopeptidase [Bacillus sp. BHET2]TMU86869.1 D-alanyl-D-alanine carboxypeptidase family protein [Bacillus sp. BHET2]